MKFLRGLLKFFAVVLAIILSITMMVTEITLMVLQSASFIITKEVILELFQSIAISERLDYEDDGELVIYEPETHYLDAAGNGYSSSSSGESSDNDQNNVIDSMINSFVKAFENLSESEKQEMQAFLEEIDIKAIIEGLSNAPIPEDASEEEVVNMLYATVTSLDTVQELVAEVSANVLDNLINDNNKDVITADTLNSLISDIAEEIQDKTGVELPEKFVSMTNTVIQDNSQTLADDLNEIVDDGIIQGILGGTAGTDGEGNSELQQLTETINVIKTILSVKTRLILLVAVVLLGGIIFLLFFKSKGGLIWDAVVTILSSSAILAIGLALNMSSSLTSLISESLEGPLLSILNGAMPVLGKQFTRTAIIGYAVAVLLIALFVVLRILKSKKAAKAAALAAKTEAEATAEEAIEDEATAEVDCATEPPVEVEGESEAPVEVQ